jgi:hypothetical protein
VRCGKDLPAIAANPPSTARGCGHSYNVPRHASALAGVSLRLTARGADTRQRCARESFGGWRQPDLRFFPDIQLNKNRRAGLAPSSTKLRRHILTRIKRLPRENSLRSEPGVVIRSARGLCQEQSVSFGTCGESNLAKPSENSQSCSVRPPADAAFSESPCKFRLQSPCFIIRHYCGLMNRISR